MLICGTLALDNPFEKKPWAKNPLFAQKLQDAGLADLPAAQFAVEQPSVVWMDAIERIDSLPLYMNSTGTDTVFIEIYNLPGPRDCAASASNGELQCNTDNCEDGLTKYKHDFLLPIRDILKQYPQKTKILFIETDSLPNSVTNYMNPSGSPCQYITPPKCSNTAMTAYYNGVIWALNELSVDDNTYFYLDTAGSGWLGWAGQQKLDSQKRPTDYPDPDAQGLLQLFIHNLRQLLESTPETTELELKSSLNNAITEYTVPLLEGGLKPGVVKRVRGFATNIANRAPLLRREDVCDLASQYNFCLDELGFIDLANHLWKNAGYEWGWVVDTGRNGGDDRTGKYCDQWCNVKSKYNQDGLPQIPDDKWLKETGYVFDTDTGKYKNNGAKLDAFFWLKDCTSDGVSKKGAKRFDCMCRRDCDKGFQFCEAPEAGEPWKSMLEYWYP
jgi:cellulase/cellobiase CelA1